MKAVRNDFHLHRKAIVLRKPFAKSWFYFSYTVTLIRPLAEMNRLNHLWFYISAQSTNSYVGHDPTKKRKWHQWKFHYSFLLHTPLHLIQKIYFYRHILIQQSIILMTFSDLMHDSPFLHTLSIPNWSTYSFF